MRCLRITLGWKSYIKEIDMLWMILAVLGSMAWGGVWSHRQDMKRQEQLLKMQEDVMVRALRRAEQND